MAVSSLTFPPLFDVEPPHESRTLRSTVFPKDSTQILGAVLVLSTEPTTLVSTLTLVYKALSFRRTLGAPLLVRAASVQESPHNTEEHPGTKYASSNHKRERGVSVSLSIFPQHVFFFVVCSQVYVISTRT